MAIAVSDPLTKWSFSCLTDGGGTKPPAGGLVLQQVQHDGHNFAKDIRVIGFWVEIETVSPASAVTATTKTFYILDGTNFTVAPITLFAPALRSSPLFASTFAYLKELDVALDFKEYFKSTANYFAYVVKAEYTAGAFFSKFPNCELAGLNVTQSFLFSPYGNSPVHEPSGALNAARCHPIVKYETTVNGAVDKTKPYSRLKSIRFDYRLHLYIDRHHNTATNATLAQIGNQAGLFADGDGGKVGIGFSTVGKGIWNKSLSTGFSRSVFDAVEKPIVLEVATQGLENGLPLFLATATATSTTPLRCWDNIHWWGARGPGSPLISAPGAFHAAHIHWRWGKPASDPKRPQFGAGWPAAAAGNPLTSGKWGPVVDPNIWMQTLRLAVVKNDPKLDPAKGVPAASLSLADWKTLFHPGLRAVPDDISAGDDIVLWYSVEVPSELIGSGSATVKFTAKTPASIFVSGIFFAHDPEITGMAVGTTDPLHFPTDEATIRKSKKWYRLAG